MVMRKYLLSRIGAVIVAALLASTGLATDAGARGVGEAVHGGVAMGSGHFRGAGVPHRFEHAQHGRARALPFGYYDDEDSGYDLPTVTPEEQPANPTTVQPANPTAVQPVNPTAVYPYAAPPRSSCSTQTYKVHSESGGEASVNVVRC
jgi:hypothetical protein